MCELCDVVQSTEGERTSARVTKTLCHLQRVTLMMTFCHLQITTTLHAVSHPVVKVSHLNPHLDFACLVSCVQCLLHIALRRRHIAALVRKIAKR